MPYAINIINPHNAKYFWIIPTLWETFIILVCTSPFCKQFILHLCSVNNYHSENPLNSQHWHQSWWPPVLNGLREFVVRFAQDANVKKGLLTLSLLRNIHKTLISNSHSNQNEHSILTHTIAIQNYILLHVNECLIIRMLFIFEIYVPQIILFTMLRNNPWWKCEHRFDDTYKTISVPTETFFIFYGKVNILPTQILGFQNIWT